MCDEWIARGYRDTMRDRLLAYTGDVVMPGWWGGPVHDTHKALLMRKKPDHYSWDVDPDLPLIWPLPTQG